MVHRQAQKVYDAAEELKHKEALLKAELESQANMVEEEKQDPSIEQLEKQLEEELFHFFLILIKFYLGLKLKKYQKFKEINLLDYYQHSKRFILRLQPSSSLIFLRKNEIFCFAIFSNFSSFLTYLIFFRQFSIVILS